ncbi:hypothetical protein Bca52824_084138 [Brassica carinata]|uniref:Retrotransposon gag domain-containing protein n=1 Tax=Brassica carinata TaxID=52824 RepID=A0A8X7PN35_BRACI|nr:hypothetical protein Bca52824_084138 [Brassica carinata]
MTRLEESLQRIGVLDTTVAELHRKFDSLDDRVNRIAASNEKSTESISATVHNPILEPNRGNNELGYRPKVEMPTFSGSDPFDWIANSKRYFRVMRVLARFAESFEKTPGKRLFGIQQTGSLAEYVREFQELAHQVKLAEENLIDIFFNGLKQEFKEVIKMKEPKTLPDHIEAVIKMEDSEFCRMFAATKGL